MIVLLSLEVSYRAIISINLLSPEFVTSATEFCTKRLGSRPPNGPYPFEARPGAFLLSKRVNQVFSKRADLGWRPVASRVHVFKSEYIIQISVIDRSD